MAAKPHRQVPRQTNATQMAIAFFAPAVLSKSRLRLFQLQRSSSFRRQKRPAFSRPLSRCFGSTIRLA
jgi:hypothetical protein